MAQLTVQKLARVIIQRQNKLNYMADILGLTSSFSVLSFECDTQ